MVRECDGARMRWCVAPEKRGWLIPEDASLKERAVSGRRPFCFGAARPELPDCLSGRCDGRKESVGQSAREVRLPFGAGWRAQCTARPRNVPARRKEEAALLGKKGKERETALRVGFATPICAPAVFSPAQGTRRARKTSKIRRRPDVLRATQFVWMAAVRAIPPLISLPETVLPNGQAGAFFLRRRF